MHAERLLPPEIAPEGYKALRAVEAYLARSGLRKSLIELVKMRASQINGCAYCLDVHAKDARRAGETEALTGISTTHAPDTDYQALRAHFSDKQIVDLTYLSA